MVELEEVFDVDTDVESSGHGRAPQAIRTLIGQTNKKAPTSTLEENVILLEA